MYIKLFLKISKEFFDLMHSQYIDNEYEEYKHKEIIDEEKGFVHYK